MTELLRICIEFLKTGFFAVGGGLATLPFLTQMQQRYQWFSAEELANMIAVSESTPGPMGVNMSTYVGYANQGIPGALAATLSLIFPSVVVILIIARFLDKYQNNALVQNMFSFMRPAVSGLIAAAGFSVLRIALFRPADTLLASVNWLSVVLFAVLLTLTQLKPLKKIHPAAFIAAGALVGILTQL